MKKLLIAAAVAALVAAGCSSDDTTETDVDTTPVFVQASTTFDQNSGGTVQFDVIDASAGVTFADNSFEVSEDGVYFIIAAPQVGGINGEAKAGCANIWIAVNGTQVANSNVTFCSSQKADGDVIVSQGVTPLAAGDIVTVQWSTDGPALEAIVTEGEPLTPSIIFSLFQVG